MWIVETWTQVFCFLFFFPWASTLPMVSLSQSPKNFSTKSETSLIHGTEVDSFPWEIYLIPKKKNWGKISKNIPQSPWASNILRKQQKNILIRSTYMNHNTWLWLSLKSLLCWTPNIFKSLRCSKPMHLGIPIHYFEGLSSTHMFLIYLQLSKSTVHLDGFWSSSTPLRLLKSLCNAPLILTAKGDISSGLCWLHTLCTM